MNGVQKLVIVLMVVAVAVSGYHYWYSSLRMQLHQASLQDRLLVINVLDKAYYDDCHIKGSIHVDFDQIEECAKLYDKRTTVVVYCSNYACTTSDYVAKKLRARNFEHVFVYAGGMAEWYQHKLPVEGPGLELYLHKIVEPLVDLSKQSDIITMQQLAALLHVAL